MDEGQHGLFKIEESGNLLVDKASENWYNVITYGIFNTGKEDRT